MAQLLHRGGRLFGLGARDPITFVALPLALLLVAILASLVPAARAGRSRRSRQSRRRPTG